MGANIGFQKTTGAKAPIAPVLNEPLYINHQVFSSMTSKNSKSRNNDVCSLAIKSLPDIHNEIICKNFVFITLFTIKLRSQFDCY